MIWNIRDYRTNKYDTKIDAVFEPSHHDNSVAGAVPVSKGSGKLTISGEYNTTIAEAISIANKNWPEEKVTLFMYNPNSNPVLLEG